MLTFILIYYCLINIAAFLFYGIDKRRARKGKWRISEAVLITLAVIGGALGAFLGMKIFHHKTLKKKFKVTVPVFLAVHIIIFGFFAFTSLQIIFYGSHYDNKKADVAIVLGAATTGKELKPVFQERINEAVRLYERGMCDKIILTGGYPNGSDVADSSLAKEYAISCGVPIKAIFTEQASTTTEENLLFAKSIMRANDYTSALVVSDPLHMKRAVMMAEDLNLGEIYSAPTQTSMYRSFSTNWKLSNHEETYYVGYLFMRLFK